jgi:hypothetical protein
MTKSMAQATRTLGAVNAATPAPQMQRVMQEYAKQSDMAEMKGEMMDDLFDDGMKTSIYSIYEYHSGG